MHSVRGTSGNVTLVITRRGNIHIPLTLHLTSDYIDPVEVYLLHRELRKEVTITVTTELLPTAPEVVTVLLTYSGNEDVILIDNEANVTILKGIYNPEFLGNTYSYYNNYAINFLGVEVGFEHSNITVDEDVMGVTLMIGTNIPNPEPDPLHFRIRTLSGTAQCKLLFTLYINTLASSINFFIDEEDYESIDSILTLAPMEQVLEYEITIFDDQRVERLEVFSVLLEIAPGQGELTLGQSTTHIFIKDNDCERQLLYTGMCAEHNVVDIGAQFNCRCVCVILYPFTYINMIC